MGKPLFSIVMPVYNVELFLREAIDSVLNQSFTEFELIIINDGSTDNSSEIIKSYPDNRIKIINQTNKGLSAARNIGISHVSGKYLTFLDSDDKLHKDFLYDSFKILSKYRVDILLHGYTRSIKKFNKNINITENNIEKINGLRAFENIILKNDIKNIPFVTVWGKIFRFEIIKDLKFIENKVHEDVFFTNQVYFKTDNIYIIHSSYYYFYRKNKKSIINSKFSIDNKIDGIEGKLDRKLIITERSLSYLLIKVNLSILMYFNKEIFSKYSRKKFKNKFYELHLEYVNSVNDLILSNISTIEKIIVKLLYLNPRFFTFIISFLLKIRGLFKGFKEIFHS